MEPLDHFAANLRRLRTAAGFSQIDLADRCEMHFTEISRLERGQRNPRLSTIVRLARGLSVAPAELLAGME